MHVRSFITPFIDQELDEVVTLQVHEHLQVCASCMELYQGELRTHSLTAVATESVEAPADLTSRLIELPHEMFTAKRGRFAESQSSPQIRVLMPLMGLSLILALVAVGGIVGLGHYQWSQRTVTPQAVSSDFSGFADPFIATSSHMKIAISSEPDSAHNSQALVWLQDHGWAAPDALPAGMSVSDLIVHSEKQLEFVITDSANHQVRIGEVVGHLDLSAMGDWHSSEVGNFEVYDDGTGLWFFQCGNHVVVIDSQEARLSAKSLVEALPEPDDEGPFFRRLVDGWEAIASALFVD